MKRQEGPAAEEDENRRQEIGSDNARTSVALSASETVSRYGSAIAGFIKGHTGIDNETGKKLAKGLLDVNKHKVNPDFADQNIKQQAGISAEISVTSKNNAEAIISGSKVRTSRTDDLPEFGKNHPVVDRVQILDGKIIEGSQSQMKFVGDRDKLLRDIARENGKFSRYRGVKIELPSEQYEGAAQHCQEQARQLRVNADRAEQSGKPDVADRLRREADNYDQLAKDVRDSGLSTDQAIFYREHPTIATALDIFRTSHRAGVDGAKLGAAVGGTISLVQNFWALASAEKTLSEAAGDLASDTAGAAVVGYGTAFVGAALKGCLQQSSLEGLRTLSNTNAPALAVNVCFSLGSSIKRYVSGEITESQLLSEVGEKGAGMLSASMMAALGQVAIPIPFVGAAVGSMIGYTLSSMFYQCALDAARDAEASREQLERIRVIEAEARTHIAKEQAVLDDFLRLEIPELKAENQHLLTVVNDVTPNHVDTLAAVINQYAELLGQRLQFQSMAEFDAFMKSDETLRF